MRRRDRRRRGHLPRAARARHRPRPRRAHRRGPARRRVAPRQVHVRRRRAEGHVGGVARRALAALTPPSLPRPRPGGRAADRRPCRTSPPPCRSCRRAARRWRARPRRSRAGAARRAARGCVAEIPHSRTRAPLRGSIGDLREQLDRGAREHAAVAGRGVERGAPRDLAEVVVLHDQDDGAGAQLGRRAAARATRSAWSSRITASSPLSSTSSSNVSWWPIETGSCSGTTGARVLAARERREVMAGDRAEPADERRLGVARDVADRRRGPCVARISRVASPTPHSRVTGSGWRNASSSSGVTTRRPSGLSMSDAIFAASLIGATPTDATSDSSVAHALLDRARDRRAVAEQALAAGDVEERLVERQPLDLGRVVAEDREERVATPRRSAPCGGARRSPCGQRRSASAIGIAEWMPNVRASYEHAATTPRRAEPPTSTGLPRSAGSSRCSTAA